VPLAQTAPLPPMVNALTASYARGLMQPPSPKQMSAANPEIELAPPAVDEPSPAADEPQLRDLFSFSAGETTFAVFADEVEATVENNPAARLPHAPVAVLGIVSVRGRMVTAIDPLALGNGNGGEWPSELPVVIALRGDEQLALAADSLRETITIASTDIEPHGKDEAHPAVLGIVQHGGKKIIVLDTAKLFSAAVRRRERRRRRF
jgi:purine-binding chemotaxis protein CheW